MFVYDATAISAVSALLGKALSDYEIARRTGVSRSTVNRWRRDGIPARPPLPDAAWRPPDPAAYSYVLGLYLGDGCLTVRSPRSATFSLVLDAAYPALIAEARSALESVFPGVRVRQHVRPRNCVVVALCSAALPLAFPQHGPGKKHLRAIELVEWQRDLTREHPRELLRGLIHSDGCRTLNTFETKLPSGRVVEYSYPRYFFSNLSADIRGIFCEHAEMLGIRWTQSNHRNISVSHRESVKLLDSFVGPKT